MTLSFFSDSLNPVFPMSPLLANMNHHFILHLCPPPSKRGWRHLWMAPDTSKAPLCVEKCLLWSQLGFWVSIWESKSTIPSLCLGLYYFILFFTVSGLWEEHPSNNQGVPKVIYGIIHVLRNHVLGFFWSYSSPFFDYTFNTERNQKLPFSDTPYPLLWLSNTWIFSNK